MSNHNPYTPGAPLGLQAGIELLYLNAADKAGRASPCLRR
jgi:hypothetical protein